MSIIRDSDSIMRPTKGANRIYLPITFDYSGGRKETNKSKIIWICIIAVIGLIVGIGMMFSKEGSFLVNILFGVLIIYATTIIIRFPILKEHKVRNNMLSMLDKDYQEDYKDIWGIYSIDDMYPYYAHLRNGKTALFVQFEKDVILGKVEDSRYEHYEAIGDAYNLLGSMDVSVSHIDYMDVIGNDDRLEGCFKSLTKVKNPDMRDLLTDIYTNLQELMDERVTTFDVYVFTFRSSESTFWYQIQSVINCMLNANYRSFKILNADDLRGLSKSIFNVHDFSVLEAYSNSLETDNYKGIIPISVTLSDGTVNKINKTVAEKKEEQRRLEEMSSNKKPSKKAKAESSKVIKEDEEIDIF